MAGWKMLEKILNGKTHETIMEDLEKRVLSRIEKARPPMSKCPKCGAEWNGIRGSAYGYTPYPCGSRSDRHGCLHQSKDCRIAQLEAENKKLADFEDSLNLCECCDCYTTQPLVEGIEIAVCNNCVAIEQKDKTIEKAIAAAKEHDSFLNKWTLSTVAAYSKNFVAELIAMLRRDLRDD